MATTAAAAPTTRDTTRPVPLLRGARGIFDLSLEGMLWSRRSLWMAVLLGLPVVFAILFRVFVAAKLPPRVTGFELYGYAIAFVYIRNLLPLVALFYASALIADEVEGKTITYLLSRPVTRASILLGKFVAYLATTLSLALPYTVLTFFVLATARGFAGTSEYVPDLFRDLGVVALALLSYGALFTLMGIVFRRPVIPGLLYLFLWELLANLPGYLPRFTLTAYLRSLVRHRPAAEGIGEIFNQVLPAGECLATLAAVTGVLLLASLWILSRREYVLEQ